MTTLHRHIAIGEQLSFDGGRIVVTMQNRTGRSASLRVDMHDDVRVDKPEAPKPPPQSHRGVAFAKA
ncbi:hypothetical protein GCM10007320_08700 [Pseudorhodoferax aquiterrae]|uniref:Uncharacterized protein n=1 Tax=Pseudorhodoferax aquiterrae TaxID=747304 RepID=A0ABQ3FWD5_9BURK|nr:hypothetical protein [Pseudorhodoferax aquiterrae]GHC72669.1 hypothetical protein GCM10007320_08700 [Pseudorhodoferax aquiterrae]